LVYGAILNRNSPNTCAPPDAMPAVSEPYQVSETLFSLMPV
jgi:hypothetical protein